MIRLSIVFSILFLTQHLWADALFPLASGRPQHDGNCWAYGGSHMIEAKTQARDGISAMTNVEKSYRYWLVYDRLLNSYHRKAVDEGDGSGQGVNDIGAFAADLWQIYQKHGFEMLSVKSVSKTPDFIYPTNLNYANSFQSNPNSLALQKPDLIKQAEQQLIHGNYTEDEAVALINETLKQAFVLRDPLLDQTPWLNGASIPVTKSFETLMGLDFTGSHSVVLLSSVLSDLPTGNWFKYNSDRSLAVSYKNPQDILTIVRASLDRGWPTTFETTDHVMTALGYKTVGNTFYYSVSDSAGAYLPRAGVTWVEQQAALAYFTDATIYYDQVADLLPAPPSLEMLLPSKHIRGKR